MTASSTSSDIVLDCRDILVEYRMSTIRATTMKEFVLAKLGGRVKHTTTRALDGVSLTAKRGECVALVGHNGCGKSTFLKVMAGILKPTRGTVKSVERIAPLIELGAGFDPELTGEENVFLSCSLMGLSRREIQERLPAIRAFAELEKFFDSPVKTYSSGMYMRLGFACATAIDADLLLIDEILAVGDENFQRKCTQRMQEVRNSGATTILVSHDINVVKSMADRVLVLDHGKVVFEGRPGEGADFYGELMEMERLAKLAVHEREEELRRKRLRANDSRKEHSDGVARILAVNATTVDSNEGRIKTGQAWALEFEIEVSQPFSQPPVIGYAVATSAGVRLFGGNSGLLPRLGPKAEVMTVGRHKAKFEFESMPLATGEYVVTAAIHDHKLERTVDIQGAAMRLYVQDENDAQNFDGDLLPPRLRPSGVRLSLKAGEPVGGA